MIDEELTPEEEEEEEAWVEFWLAAGRANIAEFEAAIMAVDVSDEDRVEVRPVAVGRTVSRRAFPGNLVQEALRSENRVQHNA